MVRIGDTSGAQIDKSRGFDLTPQEAQSVEAPPVGECHASFECRLHEDALVDKYNLFIFEAVKGPVAATPKHPETHHMGDGVFAGDGVFMVAGKDVHRRSLLRPGML